MQVSDPTQERRPALTKLRTVAGIYLCFVSQQPLARCLAVSEMFSLKTKHQRLLALHSENAFITKEDYILQNQWLRTQCVGCRKMQEALSLCLYSASL